MLLVNAKEAQTRFGEIMIKVNKEPIAISRYGKAAAVVISYEEYQKFQDLEDFYWGIKAKEAEEEGYLSVEESTNILNQILDK